MFRSRNAIKKRKYKIEIKIIDEEINRSQRHNLNFSVFVVDMSHSVPRGLSKLLPGNVVSFHLMQKYICSYDHMIGPNRRRYYIIFAQTNRDGANAVKQRIHKLAKEQNWGNLTIGTAVYPEDGNTPQALLSKAISDLS
ncbi:hypothetical protein GH153_03190 [bacterium]|nr:hypothetical protein [bacterium]